MLAILLKRPTTLVGLFRWAPDLRAHVRPITYDELWKVGEVRCRTLVFGDLERLTDRELSTARELAAHVERAAPRLRVLNDPRHGLRRYDVLTRLYEEGVNEFRAFKLAEAPPDVRWPAFLRIADDHDGPRTHPLASRQELDAHVDRLSASGCDMSRLLLVEYCDVADGNGIFHRYGAWVVGTEVVARAVLFSTRWWIKRGHAEEISDEGTLAAQRDYFWLNPHPERLREIAAMIGAGYGRFDYAVKDGTLQVWEFNTNPHFPRTMATVRPDRRRLERAGRNKLAATIKRLATEGAQIPVPLAAAASAFAR